MDTESVDDDGKGTDGATIVRMEATESVDDEGLIGDSGTDVVESVGQLLETATVFRDRHLPLIETVEVLLQENGALEAVVEELAVDRLLGGLRRGAGLIDRIHQVLGQRSVEPRGDARVVLAPLGVMLHEGGVNGAIHMIHEAELLERQFKEGTPLAEIGGVHFKDHWNMGPNVDHGNRGSSGSVRVGKSGEGVGRGTARGAGGLGG